MFPKTREENCGSPGEGEIGVNGELIKKYHLPNSDV